MGGTVVDPGPPAPYAPYPGNYGPPGGGYPSPGAPPRRPPSRALLATLAGVAAALAVGAIVFFSVFYYAPVALHHVPPGTTLVVRIDLVDVATFGPVRRHLVPLLDEAPQGAPPATGRAPRSERVSAAVGVSLTRDLREVVVCFLGSDERVAIIVGGNIPKGKLVPGILKVQAEEGGSDFADAGGYLAAKRGGLFLGQAPDGSAVLATDAATLQAALQESDDYKRLGVPEGHAVAFAATSQLWRDVASSSFASVLESVQKLKALDGLNGYLDVGAAPKMTTQLGVTAGTSPEDAKGALLRVMTDLRRASELRRKLTGASQDLAGEEQALAQAGVDTKGNVVRFVAPWPYDGLDRGAANLAQKIRSVRAGLNKLPQPAGNGIQLPGGIQIPLPGLP